MYKSFIFLFLLSVSPAFASFDAASKGTASAGFLRFGGGARGASMGEAYTAVADGVDALFWNPAALSLVKGRGATFMHSSYIESTYYNYASYAQSLGEYRAFGIGLQSFSAGDLRETDAVGVDAGRFSPHDSALSFGYAMPIRNLKFGVVFKYVRSTILNTAKTLTSDIGIIFPTLYGGKTRFALVAANIGGSLKYEEKAEKLPTIVKFGGAYVSDGYGLVSMDIGLPEDSSPFLAMGAEYLITTRGPWIMAARCGFNSQTIGDIKGFTGTSFGFGVDYTGHAFDYAFSPLGEIGVAHRLSVSVRF